MQLLNFDIGPLKMEITRLQNIVPQQERSKSVEEFLFNTVNVFDLLFSPEALNYLTIKQWLQYFFGWVYNDSVCQSLCFYYKIKMLYFACFQYKHCVSYVQGANEFWYHAVVWTIIVYSSLDADLFPFFLGFSSIFIWMDGKWTESPVGEFNFNFLKPIAFFPHWHTIPVRQSA